MPTVSHDGFQMPLLVGSNIEYIQSIITATRITIENIREPLNRPFELLTKSTIGNIFSQLLAVIHHWRLYPIFLEELLAMVYPLSIFGLL